jgi:uncharacterized protein YoaH (UPF0181 family)
MKIYLIIYMISLHDQQQPTVERIEQLDMPSCQSQAKSVLEQLRFKFDAPQCRQPGAMCSPPYIVRTICVTGS